MRTHWPAAGLALLGSLFVVVLACFPDRLSGFRPLVPLAWALPIYVWALGTTIGTVQVFNILGCPPAPNPWLLLKSFFLSQWIALFGISIPATITTLVAGRHSTGSIALGAGLAAAIGAVGWTCCS